MNNELTIKRVGNATGLFLAITFVICVGFDLLLPAHAMHNVWHDLLPGFTWLTWPSFFIGLVETFLYGWYFAIVWVPLYKFFR